MEILKINNLVKTYTTNNIKNEVIKNISLSIEKGDFLTIIGPSGSGKTTLLYTMSGLEKYDKGEIFLFNKNISTYTKKELSTLRKSKIGYIFQFFNLINYLTVYENIMLASIINNNANKDKVLEVINKVGLSNHINHYPNQLSGGQQQRTAIARCLINEPDIIFADEPTGNLDYNTGIEIIKLLKELNEKYNKTIIMVTHNNDLISFSTRTLTLKDGVIIKDEKYTK